MQNMEETHTPRRRMPMWLGVIVTCAAMLAVGFAFNKAEASTECYPAVECQNGGSQPSNTGQGGYPAAPGAQNGDNYEGLKCPAIVAVSTLGAVFTEGMSVPWTAGISATTCGIAQW